MPLLSTCPRAAWCSTTTRRTPSPFPRLTSSCPTSGSPSPAACAVRIFLLFLHNEPPRGSRTALGPHRGCLGLASPGPLRGSSRQSLRGPESPVPRPPGGAARRSGAAEWELPGLNPPPARGSRGQGRSQGQGGGRAVSQQPRTLPRRWRRGESVCLRMQRFIMITASPGIRQLSVVIEIPRCSGVNRFKKAMTKSECGKRYPKRYTDRRGRGRGTSYFFPPSLKCKQ